MQKKAGLRIIVAPLDWGLGHATRCIPVIQEFLKQGADVILVGSERVLNRLSADFPDLEKIQTDDINIKYSTWLPAYFSIAVQALKIDRYEQYSYARLQSKIRALKVDIIVSDNRYYFRSDEVYSIIITHQIKPRIPFLNALFGNIMERLISKKLEKFDEIWIPDTQEEPGLSGNLSISNHLRKPIIRIGLLSRFKISPIYRNNVGCVLLIASGPEPQQTILINEFVRIFKGSVSALTIISPKPYLKDISSYTNITKLSSPKDEVFAYLAQGASLIIMRSGYSSVMDLIRLGRRALLIPTPGQTEQEYLGEHLQLFGFSSMSQQEIRKTTSPEGLIKPSKSGTIIQDNNLLKPCIDRLIDKLNPNE